MLSQSPLFLLSLLPLTLYAMSGEETLPEAQGGGTISYVNAADQTWIDNPDGTKDLLLKFLPTDTASFTLPGMTMARILAVGGGGGGGGACNLAAAFTGNYGAGGGGGAGGMLETNGMFVAGLYQVSVGEGGAGSAKGTSTSKNYIGVDGGDTLIQFGEETLVTAYGGGGGGGQGPGNPGGSGGGGSMKNSGKVVGDGGEVLEEAVGQGSQGGSGDRGTYGGGGGGAGGEGAAASTLNPTGGIGRVSNITGTDEWYAGGGGGGWADKATTAAKIPEEFKNGIAGGKGGGGRGGVGRSTGVDPTPGEPGTGGGGGGCNANTGAAGGADGGSGVIYVRISAAIAGALNKPESSTIVYDGAAHQIVAENPFYTIDGENSATEVGVHAVQLTPIDGVNWQDGGHEAITVTLTITEQGAFSGSAEVTGATIEFAGVTGTNWINGELILKFTGAGTFTLPGSSQARILAVGGGGGGGGTCNLAAAFTGNYGGGGGGGAGGFVETNGLFGTGNYAVSVGRGGAGGAKGTSASKNYVGGDGGNTTIMIDGADWITAYGGGGGGGQGPGNPGGSGGGGSMKNSGAVVNAGGTNLTVAAGQGFAGGSGDKGTYGGGGGGAGGEGAAASTLNPTGGIGRVSNITGTDVWYAGGGGGGWANKATTSTTIPEEFKNGIAGGKGGGGRGGVGRNTDVDPTPGEPGTGGGGGGCNANTGAAGGAAGGSGIVYVRIISSRKGEFKKPDPYREFIYDREEHVSVEPDDLYTITPEGSNIGTNAGTYVAHVKLIDGVTWPDGTDEDVDVTMVIKRRPVSFIGLHIDNWEYGTASDEKPDPSSTVTPDWLTDDLVYEYAPAGTPDDGDWSSMKPEAVGAYEVRVRLPDEFAANYDFTPAHAPFSVTPIAVSFSGLVIRDWMAGTPADETPAPTCTVSRVDVTAVYEYGLKGSVAEDGSKGELSEAFVSGKWCLEKPTEVGNYVVRVRAPDFNNYAFTVLYADFQIYNGLGDLFTDFVRITVGAAPAGTSIERYPYTITLGEDDPHGFLHARAGVDGETLAVTAADGVTALPYAVVQWNEGGVSKITVRLPRLTDAAQEIVLYWHLREGKKAPDHDYNPPTPAVEQPDATFDLVCRDGLYVNYWLVKPAVDKNEWEKTETPGHLTEPGQLARGEVVMTVYDSYSGDVLYTGEAQDDKLPKTAVGAYRLVFTPNDPRGIYEPILPVSDNLIDLRITGEIVIDNLRGTAGDETLNGRVLLMNDDEAADHAITGQGHWQQRLVDGKTYDTFWDHGTETHNAPGGDRDFPYLLFGVNHLLKHINADDTTNVIWRLKDVLIGNQFVVPSSTIPGGFHGTRVYLPWSPTARGISTRAAGSQRIAANSEVGNFLLRNRMDAAVYSPCYPDGIGTIYFDMANGEQDSANGSYRIVVEVATETAPNEEGKTDPPTDELSRATVGESVFPYLDRIGAAQWKSQKIYPLKLERTATEFTPEAAVTAFDPKITSLGSTNSFYRVYVPVNVKGPARFRIRRTGVVATASVTPTNDRGGFIVLDNLLVSYPQMTARVEPCGHYREELEKTRRLILGWEGTTTVPFPSVAGTGVYGRGQPVRETSALTNISEKSLISEARLWYRWRYLNQIIDEPWTPITLSPANDFVSDDPIVLPDQEGDVEFWYETKTQIPYYRYHDYSGSGLDLSGSGYSEAQGAVTNACWLTADASKWLPSGGTNWFFRLRAGRSDYETIRLAVRGSGAIASQTPDFELVGNHIWRCFLPTPTNASGTVGIRIEAFNRQTPGDTAFAVNTNFWRIASGKVKIGGLDKLEPCGPDDWSELEVDDKAGCAMVQIDDRPDALSFTVVHGDRQDFNFWTDANKKDGKGLFVGQYELDGADPSGTSARTREFAADVTNWVPSTADSDYLRESFIVDPGDIGPGKNYPIGEPFPKSRTETPNGWIAGPGQWAAGCYNDPGTGLALQMQGQGYGYLQLVGAAARGIRSISFTARLAQPRAFDGFAYWLGCSPSLLKFSDYTFVAKGAFDTKKATAFAGAGSVSLVAYYNPGRGCYEFRITQKTAKFSGDVPTGPGDVRTLQLWRWSVDPVSRQMKATQLGSDYDLSLASMAATEGATTTSYFPMLFISCSNTTDNATVVWAGVSKDGVTPATSTAQSSAIISYCDNDATKRLSAGTFGVGSCGCPARFCYPFWYNKPVGGLKLPGAGARQTEDDVTPKWSGTQTTCYSSIRNDEWALPWDRMDYADRNSTVTALIGFQAQTQTQTVKVYTAPKGTENWGAEPVDTFDVTGFGAAGANATNRVYLYSTDDCSVQIRMAGEITDPRYDVVIDDVAVEQWRGENYDENGWSKRFSTSEINYGLPSNFVFTAAWINTDGTAKLSARRTTPTAPSSVRGPLCDGQSGRGIGLGMFSFMYENAQPNARLLVQVMTNETDIGGLATRTKSVSESYWSPLDTIDFSTMSEEERRSGTYTRYLGLHGVKGAVRVVVDPTLVREVAESTDESRFGEVDIVSLTFSDEPELDARSWWGWNLRTTDEDARRWLGDQPTKSVPQGGMSLGLNNAVNADTRTEYENAYYKHLPFLQTPVMAANLIGEISFRARKYDATAPSGSERTFVTMYGATSASAPDSQWTRIASWEIEGDVYRTYTHRMPQGLRFAAVRLAVVGVESVESYMPHSRPGEVSFEPLRVLIDEVTICESVDARVAFRGVRPFRSHLEDAKAIADIMSRDEQPLCGESFGVQAEVYAAQLSDEIDLSDARVRLWWYPNAIPWGFLNWRDNRDARSAWLAESSDTKGVYRSSYITCPSAIIEMQRGPSTVQYMLEVIWRSADGKTENTNWLESVDWEKPEWYDPLDYNRDLGQGAFSAYTILDTVAPGWAWINEFNVFGAFDADWNNSDRALQFLEIAAPGEADLTDWSVRFLDVQTGSNRVITNEVARFGDNVPGKKADLKGMDDTSKYVFHVVASPFAEKSLSQADGQRDGTWHVTDKRATEQFYGKGEVGSYYPVSIQLVRPSGIVEHEITLIGTNYYSGVYYNRAYDPQVHLDYLNDHGGHFIYVGEDSAGTESGQYWSRSLGVHNGNGGIGMALAEDVTNYWNNVHTMTPGTMNGGQYITPDWPKPHGSSIVIYSRIEGNHLRQTFGGLENTNATATLVFRKGDENGTNILYFTDRWYALSEVRANGKAVTPTPLGSRTWSLPIGKYASNDITVVASADVDPKLVERYGLGPDNRYRDAVVDWLVTGTDAGGRPWHNPEAETIGLADYVGADGKVVTNLSLTAMYWLDIDPTWTNHVMRYKAHYSQAPIPFDAGGGLTNVTFKVFMQISNTVENVAWAPYVLRSATPGMTSWDYEAAGPYKMTWGDVSFKITGILVNGTDKSGLYPRKNWLPLRWFVFSGDKDEENVPYSTSFDAGYESKIEIVDPYSKSSPGYDAGWYDWVQEHGWCPVFWSWDIDDRIRPESVEILKPDSTYKE